MSTTSGRIDTTEFKPASGITKFFLFLIISICIIAYYFSELNQMYIAGILKFFQYFLGIIFGIIGGFIGVSIGRYIQTSVGTVRVYEKSVLDIFSRKIMLKIGPGMLGCAIGVIIALLVTIAIFKPVPLIRPQAYIDTTTGQQNIYLYKDGTGYILFDKEVTNFMKWKQIEDKLVFEIYGEEQEEVGEFYAKLLTAEDNKNLKRDKQGIFSFNGNSYKDDIYAHQDKEPYHYSNLKKMTTK